MYYKEPIITKPDSIAGMKYTDYLNGLNWTDDLRSRLQHELRYGSHQSGCIGTDMTVPYPEIKVEYVEENVCNDDNGATVVQATSLSLFIVLVVKMINCL